MSRSKALLLAVGLLAVVLVGASLFADVGKLSRVAVSYPWWRLLPACALVLGNYALRSLRFRIYLRAVGVAVPWTEAALVFVAGFLFTVTPGKMGEVVKGWLLQRRRGASVADVASCVVAERFTDVVGLLAIAAWGVVEHGAHSTLFMVVVGLCVAFLGAVVHPALLPAVVGRLRQPVAASAKLTAVLDTVVQVHGVLRRLCAPSLLVRGVALAAAAWLLEALAFRVLLDGAGAAAGLGSAVVVYAMATLFGAVSMLPGGVGSTEAVMVTLCLTPSLGLALDKQHATLATLLIRFATLWFGVVLGAIAFGPAGRAVRPR